MNKNWTSLFQNHILERGFAYFCDEAVENLKITEKTVSATVEGTEDYEVEIDLNHGMVENMSCTCPYAEDGKYCKHMAAVLYAWDENKEGREPAKVLTLKAAKSQQEKSVCEIVETADIAVVKKFLISLLEEDEALFIRFKTAVTKRLTKTDMKKLKMHVDEVVGRHMDRTGFIDYYAASDYEHDIISGVIGKDVRRLIDCGDYMNAFDFLNYIFDLAINVQIDDSGGESTMIMNEISDAWEELLDKAGMEEKRDMFRWFTTRLKCYDNDWADDYLESIIMRRFEEEEFRQPKVDMVKAKIEKAAKEQDGWGRSFELGRWLGRYLNILNPAFLADPEFQKICKEYWKVVDVRQFYVAFCMKEKNYNRALEVLDESIELDKGWQGLVFDYQKKKKEIFLLQGNREAYIAQLWDMILKVEPGSLELFKELKHQYKPIEWIEKRERVFQNLSSNFSLARLYAEEKMLDRLLACVMESNIYTVLDYTKLLKEKYPEELLQKYKTEVEKIAARTGTRSHYREIAGILQTMQRIKGGKGVVKIILADWHEVYRRRPAMWDEFSRKKLQ